MTTIAPVVVPYSGAIPGGLKKGMEIEIQGTIPHFANDGFSINLSHGPQIEPTTLLHFNVRLGEQCLVLNHLHNGSWGSEERKQRLDFHKGKPFDIRILVKPQMYKLNLNGKHIADFAHRLPEDMARFLCIKGEVSISYIKFSHGGHHHGGFAPQPPGYATPAGYAPPPAGFAPPPYSGPSYPMGPVPPPSGGISQPIYNPPVPFKSGIPGGLSPGRMITISGMPHHNPSRFTINLQSGADGRDVALHFDVRFRFGSDVNTVVRNHCQSGGWGQEERAVTYFPFMANANFDIVILVEPREFKVAVNNQHLLGFGHRLPYQSVNILDVSGDVRLTQIRFQ